MYLEYFGLQELPFGITADASYAFDARAHERALNVIRLALANGEGIVKITGEVGAGKTFLCRRFLAGLGADHVAVYATCSDLEPTVLLRLLARELGIARGDGLDRHEMVEALQQALIASARDKRTTVLCLDEAHRLPVQTLDTLRLLSDLETEKQKLLHIILFGQTELDDALASESARQVRQRIASECHLGRLEPDELAPYLQRRLSAAGYQGAPLFSLQALARLAQASRGLPRLLNVLAHKCLLHVARASRREVTVTDVRSAARETIDASGPARRGAFGPMSWSASWASTWTLSRPVFQWRRMPGAGVAAALVLAAGSAWLAHARHAEPAAPAIAAAALPLPASATQNANAAPSPRQPTSPPRSPAAAGSASALAPTAQTKAAGAAHKLAAANATIAALHSAAPKQIASTPRVAANRVAAAQTAPANPSAIPLAAADPAGAVPSLRPTALKESTVAGMSASAADFAVTPAPAAAPPAAAPPAPREKTIQAISSPDRAADTYREAYGAMNQGHTDQAIAGMQLAVRQDPDYLPARRALSDLLIEQHRLPEAGAVLAEGLSRDSSRWELALSLARIQVEWNALGEAAETLRKSAPYASGNAAYRGFHAGVLEHLGRYDEAIGEYGAALHLLPGSGTWWMGMGLSLAAVARTVEARDAFQLAKASGNLSPELVQFVDQRVRELPAAAAPPAGTSVAATSAAAK